MEMKGADRCSSSPILSKGEDLRDAGASTFTLFEKLMLERKHQKHQGVRSKGWRERVSVCEGSIRCRWDT